MQYIKLTTKTGRNVSKEVPYFLGKLDYSNGVVKILSKDRKQIEKVRIYTQGDNGSHCIEISMEEWQEIINQFNSNN